MLPLTSGSMDACPVALPCSVLSTPSVSFLALLLGNREGKPGAGPWAAGPHRVRGAPAARSPDCSLSSPGAVIGQPLPPPSSPEIPMPAWHELCSAVCLVETWGFAPRSTSPGSLSLNMSFILSLFPLESLIQVFSGCPPGSPFLPPDFHSWCPEMAHHGTQGQQWPGARHDSGAPLGSGAGPPTRSILMACQDLSGPTPGSDGAGPVPGVLRELWAMFLEDSMPQGRQQRFPRSAHLPGPLTRVSPASRELMALSSILALGRR